MSHPDLPIHHCFVMIRALISRDKISQQDCGFRVHRYIWVFAHSSTFILRIGEAVNYSEPRVRSPHMRMYNILTYFYFAICRMSKLDKARRNAESLKFHLESHVPEWFGNVSVTHLHLFHCFFFILAHRTTVTRHSEEMYGVPIMMMMRWDLILLFTCRWPLLYACLNSESVYFLLSRRPLRRAFPFLLYVLLQYIVMYTKQRRRLMVARPIKLRDFLFSFVLNYLWVIWMALGRLHNLIKICWRIWSYL